MEIEADASLVPISALNHFLYCPRRCALIHVEGVFAENQYTLEGSFAHERADEPGSEDLVDRRLARGMPLWSRRHGLVGKADVVELSEQGGIQAAFPVDYKRGPKRAHDNDEVQLCAQALCLEEMLGIVVPEGAIYHVRSRRRRVVKFSKSLRISTIEAASAVRRLMEQSTMPSPVTGPRCDGCSLREKCGPELSESRQQIEEAARKVFEPEG